MLDSDDDEDNEISSTKPKSSTKIEVVEQKSSTKIEVVEQKSSTKIEVVEQKSVGDLDDVFDQSDENEHQRTWKTFDRYTSKFFKVRYLVELFKVRLEKTIFFFVQVPQWGDDAFSSLFILDVAT